MSRNIFENLGTYGSHWGITDLYEQHEARLRQSIESGDNFEARWGSKKEIITAKLSVQGNIASITVTVEQDSTPHLIDTAIWDVYGKNEFAPSGIAAVRKRHSSFTNWQIEMLWEEIENISNDLELTSSDGNTRTNGVAFSFTDDQSTEDRYKKIMEAVNQLADEGKEDLEESWGLLKHLIGEMRFQEMVLHDPYSDLQQYANTIADECTHPELSPEDNPDECIIFDEDGDDQQFLFVFPSIFQGINSYLSFSWIGQHSDASESYLETQTVLNLDTLTPVKLKDLKFQIKFLTENYGYRLRFRQELVPSGRGIDLLNGID